MEPRNESNSSSISKGRRNTHIKKVHEEKAEPVVEDSFAEERGEHRMRARTSDFEKASESS